MSSVVKDDAVQILEDYLKSHGITKSFVAKRIGLSPQAFRARIQRKSFNADTAFQVAKVLNLNPEIFLRETYTKRLK